jgi:hypothetical protein
VVDRFTGLLFSEGRYPVVQVEDDPESTDFIQAIFDDSLFGGVLHTARTFGGRMGSSLVTYRLIDGRFTYEAHSPKTIQEVIWLDRSRFTPLGVLIQYLTVREVEVLNRDGMPTGQVESVPYLCRRIIDEEFDLVFKPAPIKDPRELPQLELDPEQSWHHRLGYFPGVWIQNLPDQEEVDGISDCEGAFEMFDTVDRLYSQANFAILANMEPTLVLSRNELLDKIQAPVMTGSDQALNVGMGGSANYLEISGEGIRMGLDFAASLRQAALDRVQCVLVDPDKISGAAQSAKAIEYLYAPMLEKAGRLRAQYGQAIRDLVDGTLRTARNFLDPDKYEGNAKPFFKLPPRVERRDADPKNPDADPNIQLIRRQPGRGGVVSVKWGAFFSPTIQDVQISTASIALAKTSKLIDSDTAVRQAAPLFGQQDSDALLRRVREEEAKEQEKIQEMSGAGSSEDSPMLEAYKSQQGEVHTKNSIRAPGGVSVKLPEKPDSGDDSLP